MEADFVAFGPLDFEACDEDLFVGFFCPVDEAPFELRFEGGPFDLDDPAFDILGS